MDENIIVKLETQKIVTSTFRRLSVLKKEQIYQAAINVFSEKVFDRVSLDEIAENAGISKGSLFQYFSSKEKLFTFLLEMFANDYRKYWDDYFSREFAIRAKDRIINYFLSQLDFWDENRISFRFYIKVRHENDSLLTNDFTYLISSIQSQYLASIIARGSQTGEIRRDAEQAMIVLILSGLNEIIEKSPAWQKSPRSRINLENRLKSIMELLFDGIGA
jgi:AcrR family transcriptional regulator